MDVVVAAFETAAAVLQERRESALQRQVVISANAELRERELIKLALLGAALARRVAPPSVPDTAASLTADTGIAIFRAAFEAWVTRPKQRAFPQLIRDSFDELKAVTSGASS